jgi:hypothetical protein
MDLSCGVDLRADDNNKYRVTDKRSKLYGEKVFMENLSEERRAPGREPLCGEVLRGENLSEERRAPRRKVFVEIAVFKDSRSLGKML